MGDEGDQVTKAPASTASQQAWGSQEARGGVGVGLRPDEAPTPGHPVLEAAPRGGGPG